MGGRGWTRVGCALEGATRTQRLSPEAFSRLKKTCEDIANSGRVSVKSAEERFEHSLTQYPDPPSRLFDALMKVYADRGQWRPCMGLLERMKTMGVVAKVHTYSIAIHASRNRPNVAEHLFLKMKQSRVAPNVFTYTTLMKAISEDVPTKKDSKFGYSRSFSRVEQLWNEMTVDQNIQPSQHTYSVYLNACAKAGRPERAEAVFQDMVSRGNRPDQGTLSSLLALRVSTGSNFLPLLQTMRNLGYEVDEYTFATLARACVIARNATVAEGLFQQLKQPSVKAYGALLRCYVAAGDASGAENTVGRMMGSGIVINGFILATMAKLYVNTKSLEKLKKCFELAETKIGDCDVTTSIGTQLMTAMVEADRLSEAEELFETLLQKGLVDVVTFVVMIRAYARCSRFTEAENVLEKGRLRSDLGSQESLYNSLIAILVRAGDIERAKRVVDNARSVLRSPSYLFYSHLAKVHGASRDTDGLHQLMREVKEKRIVAGTGFYGTLIQQFASIGRYEDVELVMKESQLAGMCDKWLWRSLVRTYLDSGKISEAQNAFKRMRKAGYALDRDASVLLDDLRETMSRDVTLQ
mmetsp:Transcript_6501/g.19738  ORF Transcript_6501/g.19738 Transcript_6501/m.19738 type:complete len:581 (+) Transcript_6501:221-1963(+)